MRIKLDENLPGRLVDALAALGHDVDTAVQERLAGKDDVAWRAAQDGDRFLVTQDLDFSDIRRYTPGTHHGLLLVRLGFPGRTALFDSCPIAVPDGARLDLDRLLGGGERYRKLRLRRPVR